MNVIKKYWDAVYIYVLLSVPGFCMCAGIFWTVCKLFGLYQNLSWIKIALFDCTQLCYLAVALFFIYKNKKNPAYIAGHLTYVKGFMIFSLFVQYNFILYLFPSTHVWECTFLFFAIIVFLFDSKLMFINILSYFISLLTAHILKPEVFLPLDESNVEEILAFRLVIFILTSLCIMIIVYFAERFLIQARESNEENVRLIEKQLEYYKDMQLMDKELRKFRHDIKNHFICMESLLKNEKTEELQQYFEDLQQSFSVTKKMYFSGNDVIDAILHHDLPLYSKEGVTVTIYGSLPDIQTVSAMDLCTLFSNLFSNAFASAKRCMDSVKPQIDIHFSSGKTYFSIEMSNTVPGPDSVKKRKKKDRNHGLGIRKMKDIVEKYGGNYERYIEEQMLTIKVYLPI